MGLNMNNEQTIAVPISVLSKCLLALSTAREYPDFDGTDSPITRYLDDAIKDVEALLNNAMTKEQK